MGMGFLVHERKFMQTIATSPLAVETAFHGPIELLPVYMDIQRPSEIPAKFLQFLKPGGRRIPVSPRQADRIQRYMGSNSTEALTEDGLTAFTIAGDALVECLPEVCMSTDTPA